MKRKWPEDQGACCQECPLLTQRCVASQPPSGATRLVAIGESPGKTEVARGIPFTGASGILFNDTLKAFGLRRNHEVFVTNTVLCRPLKHMSEADWTKAIACCRPRVANELQDMPKGTPVVSMGKRALQAFQNGTKHTIRAWRGFPIEEVRDDMPTHLSYMPTYHPAFLLREPHHLPFYKLDWLRAVRGDDPTAFQWGPRYHTTVEQEVRGLELVVDEPLIAVDVENGGDGHPMFDPLLCIGLGTEDFAVTVRWPIRNAHVMHLLRRALTGSALKVLQNINHDRLTLDAHEVEMAGPFADTLPAGCVMHSKAYHDLGTMHNWYKYAPRWKTKFHTGDDKKGAKIFSSKPYSELADYNGKDCIATAQTYVAQMEA